MNRGDKQLHRSSGVMKSCYHFKFQLHQDLLETENYNSDKVTWLIVFPSFISSVERILLLPNIQGGYEEDDNKDKNILKAKVLMKGYPVILEAMTQS